MSSLYAGNANNYPDDFTIPDDGDAPTASAFNVAAEALGDRTAFLWSNAATHVLNWPTKIAPGPATNWALYVKPKRKWYVLGDSKDVRFSLENGLSWSGASAIGGGVGTGSESIIRGDFDDSANLVLTISASTDLFTYVAGTDTWAKNTSIGSVALSGNTFASYSPAANRWAFAGIDGGGTYYLYWSADRATWTLANYGGSTFGAVGAWTPLNLVMGCNRTSGRLALVQYDNAGNWTISVSDDGGDVWTRQGGDRVTTVLTPTQVHLEYSEARGQWLLTIAEVSGTPTSEVWSSVDDGASWTKIATLTSSGFFHVAAVGTFWSAIVQDGSAGLYQLAYSTDGGITWKRAGISVEGTAKGVFAGGGGLLAATASYVYMSVRAGLPDLGAFA